VAFNGLEIAIVSVSFGSMLVSPTTLTGIVLAFSPGANVTVPLAEA